MNVSCSSSVYTLSSGRTRCAGMKYVVGKPDIYFKILENVVNVQHTAAILPAPLLTRYE